MLTIEGHNTIDKIGNCNYRISRRLPNGNLLKMHYIYLTKKEAVKDFNSLYKRKKNADN